MAYGTKQQLQLLGTLPQAHTCANTLELPNYVEALTATHPELVQPGNSSLTANEALQRRCCEVLEDRLLVSKHVSGADTGGGSLQLMLRYNLQFLFQIVCGENTT